MANLFATYETPIQGRKVKFQLNVKNLFDRTYYTRLGGTNTYNTYGDPRNFQLTLRAQF